MKNLLFALPLIAVVLGCGSISKEANSTGPAETPLPVVENAGPLTEDEKKYLGSVGGYLKSSIEANTELAQTMNRQAPLPQIKRAVERARRIENAAFAGDYLKNKPTDSYGRFDKDIREIHRSYNAAYDDYLRYFSTDELQYIETGSDKFKDAVNRSKSTLEAVNKALGEIKTEKEKTTRKRK